MTPAVAADRIRRRWAAGGDASDATVAVASAMAAVEQPWPEATLVETAAGPADVRAAALAAV